MNEIISSDIYWSVLQIPCLISGFAEGGLVVQMSLYCVPTKCKYWRTNSKCMPTQPYQGLVMQYQNWCRQTLYIILGLNLPQLVHKIAIIFNVKNKKVDVNSLNKYVNCHRCWEFQDSVTQKWIFSSYNTQLGPPSAFRVLQSVIHEQVEFIFRFLC